jgi:hypothetical protein
MYAVEHRNSELFTWMIQDVFISLEPCPFVWDEWTVE